MKKLLISLTLAAMSLPSVAAETNLNYQQKLAQIRNESGDLMSYQQLIEQYKLTGLSLAVIDDYNVVFTQEVGLKESGTRSFIDEGTAFSTASISKPVTATIAFMLAEQGKLDLDKPVEHYLKRWKLPESPLTENTAVTLRHLLSHTAGTSQSGYADFFLGDDMPSLIDTLNGKKLPRYNTPISFIFEPGTDWQYSGGGYVIAQVAIEDITGKSLADLAQTMLFAPLNMRNTSMYEHGDRRFVKNLAKIHDKDQNIIGSGISISPQTAPSGMWSSSLDMAKFVIAYQKALSGIPGEVISQHVARNATEIMSIDNIGSWGFGGWSAGWMRFEGAGNREWFSHGGSNTGIGGHIMGTMEGGKGIVIFGNGPTPVRMPVINAIKAHVIRALGWEVEADSAPGQAPESLLAMMPGRYLSSFEHVINIEKQNDELIIHNLHGQGSKRALLHAENDRFGMEQSNIQVGMEQGKLTFYRKGSTIKDQSVRKLAANQLLPIEVARKENFSGTLQAYQAWKKQNPESRLHSAGIINRSGYRALGQKDFDLAVKLFKVYTHLYPQDANAYDSLGEAYMLKGDKKLAIENFQKSLSLNPENKNALEMLNKLAS